MILILYYKIILSKFTIFKFVGIFEYKRLLKLRNTWMGLKSLMSSMIIAITSQSVYIIRIERKEVNKSLLFFFLLINFIRNFPIILSSHSFLLFKFHFSRNQIHFYTFFYKRNCSSRNLRTSLSRLLFHLFFLAFKRSQTVFRFFYLRPAL